MSKRKNLPSCHRDHPKIKNNLRSRMLFSFRGGPQSLYIYLYTCSMKSTIHVGTYAIPTRGPYISNPKNTREIPQTYHPFALFDVLRNWTLSYGTYRKHEKPTHRNPFQLRVVFIRHVSWNHGIHHGKLQVSWIISNILLMEEILCQLIW